MPVDQRPGQAQLQAQLTDLVLKEGPKGLHDPFEADALREAPHVVVGLDDGPVAAGAGLHHVGVDGALGEEVQLSQLVGCLLEGMYELLADDLPLLLGIHDPLQGGEEPVPGVHAHEVEIEIALRAEDGLHLLALVLAQQAVIHEHAGELLADGPG